MMRQFQMKVQGSLKRGMMYAVGIVVKKAIMPEVANNLNVILYVVDVFVLSYMYDRDHPREQQPMLVNNQGTTLLRTVPFNHQASTPKVQLNHSGIDKSVSLTYLGGWNM